VTAAPPLILVIEDEPQIRRFLRAGLSGDGAEYRILEADTGRVGLTHATTQPPDAVILDLGLPDMDGLEVTRRLREWSSVPIIVLSARGQEKDKIAALDLGADDYLTKPFGIAELRARLRVALRHAARTAGGAAPALVVGGLKVDLAARRVHLDGAEIHLTPIEYKLLATLAKHPGKVLTHSFLLKEVWGPANERESHYLRVFMANLRRKLEENPARPRYLLTEQGVGYRLADE
jgi:two-component system KDP operon response regulator KdpE